MDLVGSGDSKLFLVILARVPHAGYSSFVSLGQFGILGRLRHAQILVNLKV